MTRPLTEHELNELEISHLIGVRGRIVGDHPWTGRTGTIVRVEMTMMGWGVVVRLDPAPDVPQDQETFVFDGRKNWRRLSAPLAPSR